MADYDLSLSTRKRRGEGRGGEARSHVELGGRVGCYWKL